MIMDAAQTEQPVSDPARTIVNAREELGVRRDLDALAERKGSTQRVITDPREQRAPIGTPEREAQLTALRRKIKQTADG